MPISIPIRLWRFRNGNVQFAVHMDHMEWIVRKAMIGRSVETLRLTARQNVSYALLIGKKDRIWTVVRRMYIKFSVSILSLAAPKRTKAKDESKVWVVAPPFCTYPFNIIYVDAFSIVDGETFNRQLKLDNTTRHTHMIVCCARVAFCRKSYQSSVKSSSSSWMGQTTEIRSIVIVNHRSSIVPVMGGRRAGIWGVEWRWQIAYRRCLDNLKQKSTCSSSWWGDGGASIVHRPYHVVA